MRLLLFFIWMVLFAPTPTFANSLSSLLHAGNTAYSLAEYEKSLQKYQEALAKNEMSYPALFNKGNSLYKLERYDEALTAYNQALNSSDEPAATAAVKFNMGNTLFQQAAKTGELSDKLERLQKSGRNFQQALQYDHSLQDAGRNLEICRRTIKEIEEQQRQQQEQRQQAAEQQQNLQKQLENLQKEQQKLADSNRQKNGQTESGNTGKDDQRRENVDNQKKLRRQTEELTEQLNSSQGPEEKQNSQALDQLQQAVSEQKRAENNLEQNKNKEAQQQQQKAANLMQQAGKSLKTPNEKKQASKQLEQESNKDQGMDEQQAEMTQDGDSQKSAVDEENMAMESTEQTLEEILNAERKLQQMRKNQRARDRLLVDKDW